MTPRCMYRSVCCVGHSRPGWLYKFLRTMLEERKRKHRSRNLFYSPDIITRTRCTLNISTYKAYIPYTFASLNCS